MNTDDIVQKLASIGLSNNESKVFLTMLGKGNFMASEAAYASGVPRQMMYRVLSRLIERGLCTEVSNNPRKFFINDPSFSLISLLDEEKRKIESVVSFLPQIAELFNVRIDSSNPRQSVTIIKDPSISLKLHQELQAKAEKEILFFVKGPYSSNAEKPATLSKKAPRKGASLEVEGLCQSANKYRVVRALYELENGEAPLPDLIEKSIHEAGEEARLLEYLPVKGTVYDRCKSILILQDETLDNAPYPDIMLIEHKGFSTVLYEVFNIYWQKAVDYWEWKQSDRKL
ncbi:MAG: helix-turn-helix domain-containing protein [Candidatus Electryonea clarkiae]|nr:helix-turn-helix domain-containing protein [Candidatus Electryonea clarkiae]